MISTKINDMHQDGAIEENCFKVDIQTSQSGKNTWLDVSCLVWVQHEGHHIEGRTTPLMSLELAQQARRDFYAALAEGKEFVDLTTEVLEERAAKRTSKVKIIEDAIAHIEGKATKFSSREVLPMVQRLKTLL